MKIGNILSAIVKVVKSNPTLVVGAISVGKQIVAAVKAETKKPKAEPRP
jgi:hypothetical protein